MSVEYPVIVVGKAFCHILNRFAAVIQYPTYKKGCGSSANKRKCPLKRLPVFFREHFIYFAEEDLVIAYLHLRVRLTVVDIFIQAPVFLYYCKMRKGDFIKIVNAKIRYIVFAFKYIRCVAYKLMLKNEYLFDYLHIKIVYVSIIGVEGASVDVRLFAQLFNRYFVYGFFLHKLKQAVSYHHFAVFCPSVLFFAFHVFIILMLNDFQHRVLLSL